MDIAQLVRFPIKIREVMGSTPYNPSWRSAIWHYPPSKAASEDTGLAYVVSLMKISKSIWSIL